jgi:hypothetical protein
MSKNTGFRSWYYFRMGWSTYFAFIFAAINTLTVTYYLAIEKIPVLGIIFPTFIQYVVIVSGIGVPILIAVGYVHYKRSKAFKSEVDIIVETNPYGRRTIVNTELLLEINLKLMEFLVRLSKNEKINEQEIKELIDKNKKISEHMEKRTFSNDIDLNFLRKVLKQ